MSAGRFRVSSTCWRTGRIRPGPAGSTSIGTAEGHDGFGYRNFEGHGALVALNHDSPAVADYVASVMEHWLDRGIDGWRLDAAYAVPLDFWHTVTDRVRAAHPGRVVRRRGHPRRFRRLGTAGRAGFGHPVRAVEIDLEFAERRQFLRAGLDPRAARGFLRDFVPLTFVGNHDVTRIASKLDRSAAPRPRAGRAVHHAGCPERLLRRRAGLPSASRRSGRAATTPSGRLSPPARTNSPGRLADLPAAPAADRAATAGGLADRRADRGGDEDQRTAAGAGQRSRRAGDRGAAEHRR